MTNKFADPRFDIVFKNIFADQVLLIDFINKVLPTKNFKKVEYIPTIIEPEIRVKKQSVLDLLFTDENGSKCIVEMQSEKEKGFRRGVLDYAYNGSQYSDILEVVFIVITDFVMFPEKTDYLSFHSFRDEKTNEQTLKDVTFVFIEIPKYEVHDNPQGIDEWIDLFKTASHRKTIQTSNPIIKKAYEKLEISNWTNQELLDFQAHQNLLLNNQAREDQVYDEGK
jgi:predicted transposase/invertase (TIGR01784 family)